MIVAADTLTSSTGKKSTIFVSWLKNFTVTVFMQTLHALYMLVVLQILANLYGKLYVYDNDGNLIEALEEALTEGQISIVTIILTTGLVKLEKLFKSMFNIGDSFAGDLKAGTQSMMKAMGAVKGIAAGAKAVGDNAGKYKDAVKRKQAYTNQLNLLKGPQHRENARIAFEAAKTAKSEGNMDEYRKQREIAAGQLREAKKYGVAVDPKKGFETNKDSGSRSDNKSDSKKNNGSGQVINIENGNNEDYLKQILDAQNGNNGNYLEQVLNAQNNPKYMTREQKIQRLQEGIAKAEADMKSARFAEIMGPANLAAGLGVGLGMGEDISEALFKGGYITVALDKGAEVVGHMSADKDRKTFYNYEKREGQKYGYTPSEKIIREKTIVEKTVEKVKENPRLAIDPIAVGKEIGKQFQGVGSVLSNTMERELRQIDRSLDDSQ